MVKHCIAILSLMAFMLSSLLFIPGVSLFAHEAAHSRIARLTHEMEKTPTDATLYLQRGDAYQQHSLWEKALADFQRVAELKPDYKLIAYRRGRLFYSSGRYEQAEKELNDYLSNAYDNVPGLILRARVLRKLNKIDRSHANYTRAISKSTKIDASLYIERAELLIEGGDCYLDLALYGLNEGVRKLGPLISFELASIDINIKQENYAAAIKRIDNVISRVPRKEKWLVRRAEVLEQAGRYSEARIAYMSALDAIEVLPVHQSRTPALALLKQHAEVKVKKLH